MIKSIGKRIIHDMISRNLKNYKWCYENGVAILFNKKTSATFELPIFYVNSFIRAGLTFINVYRKDQLRKSQVRINSLRLSKATSLKKSFEKRKRLSEVIVKCQGIIKNYEEAKQQKLI